MMLGARFVDVPPLPRDRAWARLPRRPLLLLGGLVLLRQEAGGRALVSMRAKRHRKRKMDSTSPLAGGERPSAVVMRTGFGAEGAGAEAAASAGEASWRCQALFAR